MNYGNDYQQNNSCNITYVLLSYIEILKTSGNWNYMNENA